MMRLYVVSEGLTEFNFVTQILRPHLEQRSSGPIAVDAPRLGGHYTYAKLRRFVKRLLGSPTAAVLVSTMIDLYGVAGDFPGLGEPADNAPPLDRVRHLESCCRQDINDPRFIPYLQLHEFEALLLPDVELLVETVSQSPHRASGIGGPPPRGCAGGRQSAHSTLPQDSASCAGIQQSCRQCNHRRPNWARGHSAALLAFRAVARPA
jgi:hypothetical protein